MALSIEEQLQQLSSRLARIENQLHLPPTPPTTPKEAIARMEEEDKNKKREQAFSPQKNTDAEFKTSSGNWLGMIAIICFVLAAGFIIKLSIDSGWLTPARQIGIAALFGFALIGTGMRLLAYDSEYASLLPASGIIILYLATFAAHRFYSLIPFELAIALSGVISLFCIYLYIRIEHDIYPVTAAIGAYIAPIILDFHVNTQFSLYYFVICSLTFATLSIWVQSRTLTVISAYLAIIATAFVGLDINQNMFVARILSFHFLIFSFGTYLYTRYTNFALTEKESWSFFPVLLLFYAVEYYFISQINADFAAWISLSFAAFVIILYTAARIVINTRHLASESMIFAFVAIIFFHSGYIVLLPDSAGPWLFIALTIGFALLPTSFLDKENTFSLPVPMLVLIITIASIEFAKMVLGLWNDETTLLTPFLSAAGLWLLYIYKNNQVKKEEMAGYALLAAAHLLVVLTLYRLTEPYNSFLVSSSWLIYAISIISIAFMRKDKVMANSALLVLGFAAGKVLLYDVASAPTIVRILCLLITGTVLYGAGFMYKKIAKWKD